MADSQNDAVVDIHLAATYLRERHESRYPARIQIEISGLDRNGDLLHESTFTRDISKWGCSFLSSIELAPNDMISLRVMSREPGKELTERQSPYQVLRVTREDDGWLVAAWKLDSRDLWTSDLHSIQPKNADRESRKVDTRNKPELIRKDSD